MPATSQNVRYSRLRHLVNVDAASIVTIELFQSECVSLEVHSAG